MAGAVMQKGLRERRWRPRLLRAALVSLAIHALGLMILLEARAIPPEETLVPVTLTVEPARAAKPEMGDGQPAGGGERGFGAVLLESGDDDATAVAARHAWPGAVQTVAAAQASATLTAPRIVSIGPPQPRPASGPRDAAEEQARPLVSGAPPPTLAGRRSAGPRGPGLLAQAEYKPLFVAEGASAEEVERFWKMRVLEQQLVVTQQSVATINGREVEMRAPGGPASASAPAPAPGQAAAQLRVGSPGASGGNTAAGPASSAASAGGTGSSQERAGSAPFAEIAAQGGSGNGSGAARGEGNGTGESMAAVHARLGGRVTPGSRVSRAPRLADDVRGTCRTSGSKEPSTVIRLLVEGSGAVSSSYVLRSSGDPVFNACALGFVQKARFVPGADAADHPLNVWLHAYVTTTTCADGACRTRLQLQD